MTTTELADYLTPAQAARVLELSSKRVSQLCDAGRLPCIRTSLGWRLIPRAVVRDFARDRGVAVD